MKVYRLACILQKTVENCSATKVESVFGIKHVFKLNNARKYHFSIGQLSCEKFIPSKIFSSYKINVSSPNLAKLFNTFF